MSYVFASGKEFVEFADATTTHTGFKALYIGGDGDVVISPDGGTTSITFSAATAGSVLPVTGTSLMAATTATNVVGLKW